MTTVSDGEGKTRIQWLTMQRVSLSPIASVSKRGRATAIGAPGLGSGSFAFGLNLFQKPAP